MATLENLPVQDNQCPNCSSNSSSDIGDYRYNVESDRLLLSCERIRSCDECSLVFAAPTPSADVLLSFYTNTYRAPGRPHFSSYAPEPVNRHLSYLSYLTHELDFSKISNVLEIGAGWGEFGEVLLRAFPHLQLFTFEPDPNTQEALQARGYTLVNDQSGLPGEVDLVVATHCLEHFSAVDDFFELFSDVIRPGGYLFLEVPNCPFGRGFDARPYDSPHLLFFDKDTLSEVCLARGLEIAALHTVGHSLELEFQLCRDWKLEHEKWTAHGSVPRKSLMAKAKMVVKTAIPPTARTAIQVARGRHRGQTWQEAMPDYALGREDAWMLRGLFQQR